MIANKERSEQEAERLLNKYKITEAPVPVEKLAKELNAEISYQPFNGDLDGVLYRDDEQVIIGVNSSDAETRQRFTIAHELGHLVMHNGHSMHIDRDFVVNFRDSSRSPEESEANLFAAALLMPKNLILNFINENGLDLSGDSDDIYKLAKHLKVSQQALLIRLGALGLTY